MKCVICKNESTIVFKHVPALVCSNCGEKYVEDDVAKDVLKSTQEIFL